MGDSVEVEKCLQTAEGPLTLEEVAQSVSSSLAATERALTELADQGVVVVRDVPTDFESESSGGTSCKLYWTSSNTPTAHRQQLPAVTPIRIGPSSRKSRMPFKSPARISSPVTPMSRTPLSSRRLCRISEEGTSSVEELTSDVEKLHKELARVEKEMAGLSDCYSEGELQQHIDKLHEYNEVKDMGQLLLGKLAEVEGTTTATLYEQFGLGLND